MEDIWKICKKWITNLRSHPSGLSVVMFQNPSRHTSHRRPSTWGLQMQRPAIRSWSGSVRLSHSPPCSDPMGSQSHSVKNESQYVKIKVELYNFDFKYFIVPVARRPESKKTEKLLWQVECRLKYLRWRKNGLLGFWKTAKSYVKEIKQECKY